MALAGIQDVAQQAHSLAHDPGFAAVLGGQAHPVTSLVFADVAGLLGATQQSGTTSGSLAARLAPDLRRITGVGLTSTRGADDSTTQVSVAVTP